MRLGPDGWSSGLPDETLYNLGQRAVTALAEIHRIDWEKKAPYLGPPWSYAEDIERWDFFYGRFARSRASWPGSRKSAKNFSTINPRIARSAYFTETFKRPTFFAHAKANCWPSSTGELVGVGATLNDLGWLVTFNDSKAWDTEDPWTGFLLDPDTLIEFYAGASDTSLQDLNWFRALAAYKFSIITGFNLGLHRSGKRPDPAWEKIGPSMSFLVDRALDLLG